MTIRIAIADDHPMIVDGLQNMLAGTPCIVLTATYSNGAQLLKGLQNDVPDVLLLDIQMPGKTGDELAAIILKKHPEIRIIALTNFDSALYVGNMLRNGALGYLLKTTDKHTLIEAIEAVYEGRQYLDVAIRDKAGHTKQKSGFISQMSLTLREKQILQQIVNGSTSQEIAASLFLSLKTIENYRSRIFLKLDVKNVAELVKKALQMGLAD